MNYTDKQVEAMIAGVEAGTLGIWNLPVDYYTAFTDYLSKAVLKGFRSSLKSISQLDIPLLEQLLTNVYMFGAAKTFQQTAEISRLLVDENGRVRSSREFNRMAADLYDNWNNNWGKTEYTTAIGQADMAAKWQTIERNKDVLPTLKYDAVIDPNTSAICRPLDGIVAPVNDPIWKKISPLNHFNCRCVLIQGTALPTGGNDQKVNEVIKTMQPAFVNNPGISGMIFTQDHPYFQVANEYRDYAKQNFKLPIPKFQLSE